MSRRLQPSAASVRDDDEGQKPAVPAADQFTYDLSRLTLADMVRCGGALRGLAAASATMEEAAGAVTRHLYDNLKDKNSGDRCCVLVRFFKTHVYAQLPSQLQKFAAANAAGTSLGDDTKCLTMLGTAGDEPRWNSRQTSQGHQCIPLASEAIVDQFPMIAQLVRQLGLTTTELLRATPEIIDDLKQKSFGVFHVPVAVGSPFIPAQQDFVKPHAIASALGFGGMLPDGELFVVIIFSRAEVPAAAAQMFRTIALNLKLGILALLEMPVFAD